ncbi:prolipoprotein diacylglyceryl transferase [Roseovarius sp. 2305UL8-3]|uniref:prolipoprotein diacylglyceryl transferase n=1 Tax=Roseovarius conchicola TaxID=3121636 RepID=UPI00352857FC
MTVHLVFDLIAATCASALTFAVYFWRLRAVAEDRLASAGPGYAFAALLGAAIGAYGLGTANLWLSGIEGVGRSILGSLVGAIAGVELYKRAHKITGSTGVIFVAGFTATIVIGRLGCFFAGLDDHTFGTPTDLPWGVDFGDGIARHPVQLYESGIMAAFLVIALILLARRSPWFLTNGFYLMCATYGVQRFGLEFLKPYATVLGPLNIFHVACLGLIFYAVKMIRRPNV